MENVLLLGKLFGIQVQHLILYCFVTWSHQRPAQTCLACCGIHTTSVV